MPSSRDTEETAVIATYTTRRDAEMARDCLEEAEIQAFVRADDAGGMHPQLQQPHGVQLVGMSGTAQRARTVLADAGLLPEEGGTNGASADQPVSERTAGSMYGVALVLGAAAVVLVLLMFLLG